MKGYIAQRLRSNRVTAIRYATALLVAIAGVLLAMWVDAFVDPAVLLLMAVMVAGWFSGLWPGMLAVFVSTLALSYFFTPPLHTLYVEPTRIPHVLAFAVIAGLFVSASVGRRQAERSMMHARDELETKVRERTADLTRTHAEAVAAQQRFRELVNSVEGIVWEADARTFQFTFVSTQAERVLGYSVDDWLREPSFWKDHLHPADRDWAVNACIAATKAGRNHDLEYRMLAADGRVVWVRDLITVIDQADGPRLRGVMVDITTRRRAEEALREQAALLDLTHDTIFVRDMDDVIRYWNRGATDRYGWTSEEAIGRVSHDVMRTVFPGPLEQITGELLRNGRWEGELRHTRRDGSQVIVASRWSLLRDGNGQPIAVLETNNDVTERKHAEDMLRRSEASLAEAQRLSHIGSWIDDVAAGTFTASAELRRITGYAATEPVTKDMLRQRIHPDDLPHVEHVVEEGLRRKRDFEFEHRIVLPDRSIRHVNIIGHPVVDATGAIKEVVGSLADITRHKRAEAELRESERRHRHIFQATGVSIWEEDFTRVKAAIDELRARGITDLREYLRNAPEFIDHAVSLVRIVDVNEATLKLFGAANKEELLGSLQTVFTAATREVFAGELIAIAEGQTLFEGETILRKLNGDPVVALFSVSFPPPGAAFDAVLVSIIDITDRKRAEQELEELAGRLIHAQEEERRRIGRELHDHTSQMLGVLTIRIDQLRADEETPSAVAEALHELRQSTAEITDDIHSLSHRLHSSALDYLGLIPALQRLIAEFSTRHDIEIDFAHAAVPSLLPSEVALCLFRVTEESLTNIAKHSRAKSARVCVNGGHDGIGLTIEDTGAGFDPEALERKAGLGFVSMRERLRVVRGTLRVQSAPSRGTRIDVLVPAASLVTNVDAQST